jgi:hypothetical protein
LRSDFHGSGSGVGNHTYIDTAGLLVGPKKIQQVRPRVTRGKISGIPNCLNNSVIFMVYWYLVMWPRVRDAWCTGSSIRSDVTYPHALAC